MDRARHDRRTPLAQLSGGPRAARWVAMHRFTQDERPLGNWTESTVRLGEELLRLPEGSRTRNRLMAVNPRDLVSATVAAAWAEGMGAFMNVDAPANPSSQALIAVTESALGGRNRVIDGLAGVQSGARAWRVDLDPGSAEIHVRFTAPRDAMSDTTQRLTMSIPAALAGADRLMTEHPGIYPAHAIALAAMAAAEAPLASAAAPLAQGARSATAPAVAPGTQPEPGW